MAERARHAEELAAARQEAARILGERDQAQDEIDRLMAIIKELQRHRFGRRAERLDPDQLGLALEDLEQTLAAAEAAAEKTDGAAQGDCIAPAAQQSRRAAAALAA